MTQHIGIVACSAEGAALCYRTIALEGAQLMGTHDHPEVSMHTHALARYMSCIHADDWPGVADLMLSSADKLAAAGADFLICPDNTIHQAFDLVEQRSPRPWLHIAQEVANEARRSQFKRMGVLGTRYLMEGPGLSGEAESSWPRTSHPGTASAGENQPDHHGRTGERPVHSTFSGVLSGSNPNPGATRAAMQWCSGCTEIPLLVTPDSSSLPTLDSTRLLAKAAVMKSAGTI